MKTARFPARLAGLLPTLALVALAAAPARADAKLRWKFTKGKPYHYTITQKTQMKMVQGPGQEISTVMNQVTDLTWDIKAVDPDGSASMTLTTDRVRIVMDSPVFKLEFDSKDPKDPTGPAAALAPVFRAMVGVPIEMKMSGRGQISDVKVPPKLLDALKNAGPGGAAATNSLASEEGIKTTMSRASLVLPEEAVAPGKSWKSNVELPAPPMGTMALDSTYTYKGPATQDGHKVEKVDLATKVDLKPSDNPQVTVKVKSQDNQGAFYFDNADGYLRGSEVNQKMELGLTVMDQELVQNVETSVKMEPTKPEAGSPGQAK
jgi:hypothetical protein